MRILYSSIISLFCALLLVSAGHAELLQRDLLLNLVTGLGWDFGLPDRPGDEDYLRIVNGNRKYHYEAEYLILPTDMVALKKLRTFGDFSGQHWVSGVATRTSAHLQFLVPIGGRYEVRASLLHPGHLVDFAGQQFRPDGGERFTLVKVGEVDLFPGIQQMRVELPPGGGIDFIELLASSYPPIGPIDGWQPDEPLQWQHLASTSLQLLEQEKALPVLGKATVFEAELAVEPGNATISSAVHFGRPSAGRWLRVGSTSTTVIVEFEPPQPGIYLLTLRGLAESKLKLTLDSDYLFSLDFASTLGRKTVGALHLSAGTHKLAIELPPRAGLDSIELTPLRSSPEDYLALAGYDQKGAPPQGRDIDGFIALMRKLAPQR